MVNLDSQILNRFLLTSNHDLFLLKLDLEEALNGTIAGGGLIIKFSNATAIIAKDGRLYRKIRFWRLLSERLCLGIDWGSQVLGAVLLRHKSYVNRLLCRNKLLLA